MPDRNAQTAPVRLVTIDGPAGVGKTTLAKRIAAALGLAYLDTGAMFRAAALLLDQSGRDFAALSEEDLGDALNDLVFTLAGTGAATRLLVNGRPIGDAIRTEAVGARASLLATRPAVRAWMLAAQRAIGAGTALAAEGRDMGTAVFPEAAFKFFLDASPEIRAERRVLQLRAMNLPADLPTILEQIRQRDDQDRNRTLAPLRPAADAVVIDTSRLSIDQVFERILGLAQTS